MTSVAIVVHFAPCDRTARSPDTSDCCPNQHLCASLCLVNLPAGRPGLWSVVLSSPMVRDVLERTRQSAKSYRPLWMRKIASGICE